MAFEAVQAREQAGAGGGAYSQAPCPPFSASQANCLRNPNVPWDRMRPSSGGGKEGLG